MSLINFLKHLFCLAIISSLSGCAAMTASTVTSQHSLNESIYGTMFMLKKDLEGKTIPKEEVAKYIPSSVMMIGLNKTDKYFWYEFDGVKKYKYSRTNSYAGRIPNTFVVNYEKGIANSWLEGRDGDISFVRYIISYSIKETNDMYEIRMDMLDKYYTGVCEGPMSNDYCRSLPIEVSKALNDVKLKITQTKHNLVPKQYTITGEVNSNYNPESTYANFERKLGVFVDKNKSTIQMKYQEAKQINTTDIEKKKVYNYKYKDELLPLSVAIYPYRNGSKVIYELTVPYVVSDKYSLTQGGINEIKSEIAKISND